MGSDGSLVVDLSFLYHPSCRYNDAWQCPLARRGTPSPPRSAQASDSEVLIRR
jgi:uncharacterized protein (DUF1684 family)